MGLAFTKSWHFLDLAATLKCDSLVRLVYLPAPVSHKVSLLKGHLRWVASTYLKKKLVGSLEQTLNVRGKIS